MKILNMKEALVNFDQIGSAQLRYDDEKDLIPDRIDLNVQGVVVHITEKADVEYLYDKLIACSDIRKKIEPPVTDQTSARS